MRKKEKARKKSLLLARFWAVSAPMADIYRNRFDAFCGTSSDEATSIRSGTGASIGSAVETIRSTISPAVICGFCERTSAA